MGGATVVVGVATRGTAVGLVGVGVVTGVIDGPLVYQLPGYRVGVG